MTTCSCIRGEHILSGLVAQPLFGYDNVGFHMGAEGSDGGLLTALLELEDWIGWRMRPISWCMPMCL